MFRFTIRDVLWLMVVAGLVAAMVMQNFRGQAARQRVLHELSRPIVLESNAAMSGGHALRQRQQEIDDPLILAIGHEVQRLLVAQIRVRGAHPESGSIVSHDPSGQVHDGPKLQEAFLGVAARNG